MALVSKVRTISICLKSGRISAAGRASGGRSATRVPSGPRYWRYSISKVAATLMRARARSSTGAGHDTRRAFRVRCALRQRRPWRGRGWSGVRGTPHRLAASVAADGVDPGAGGVVSGVGIIDVRLHLDRDVVPGWGEATAGAGHELQAAGLAGFERTLQEAERPEGIGRSGDAFEAAVDPDQRLIHPRRKTDQHVVDGHRTVVVELDRMVPPGTADDPLGRGHRHRQVGLCSD